jgi:NitT/TauT family transport system substrate-binding protein
MELRAAFPSRTAFLASLAGFAAAAPALAQGTGAVTGVFGRGASGLTYSAEYIALEKGLWKQAGLDLQIVEARGAAITAALLSGQTDIGASVPLMFPAVARGADLVAFAEETHDFDAQYVLSNSALATTGITPRMALAEKTKRLKGIKLGYSQPGSTVDQLTRYLLNQFGMNADTDIQLVALGTGPAMVEGLEHGTVDGFVFISPYADLVEQRGLGKIIINQMHGDIPSLRGFVYTSYYGQRQALVDKRQVFVRFVKGLILANLVILNQPDDAAQITGSVLGLDPALIRKVLVANKSYFELVPTVHADDFQRTLSFYNTFAANKLTKPAAEMFDTSIVAQAASELRREGKLR